MMSQVSTHKDIPEPMWSLGDDVAFFSNSRQIAMFVYIHKTQTNNELKKTALQHCELEMGEDIHQVSKHLMKRRPRNP
jgi:hypothetical protein